MVEVRIALRIDPEMQKRETTQRKSRFGLAPLLAISWALTAGNAGAATYYASATGDDAADGLSPTTAWLTIEKVNRSRFSPGDAILFKRGNAWREGQALFGLSNGTADHPIVFGAYGEGPKPRILGSRDLSSAAYWTRSSGNIWKTTSIINITTRDFGRGQRTPDVSNLIFNQEKSIGVKKRFLEDLKQQGDFCLNLPDTLLYLYSTVNPSEYYENIEAAGIRNCENNIEIINGHHLVFDHLDVRYSKNNGIFLQDCSDIVIRDCDFSWIGGCYFPIQTFMNSPRRDPARMGNAVQLWRGNSDITVEYCRFDQIYDAGISPQGGDNQVAGKYYAIKDLRFHHNVINRCFYSFEFWGHDANSAGDGIFFENNTCLNAGMGWSTAQRPDKSRCAHLQFGTSKMAFSNIFIRNNIFDASACFASDGGAESNGANTDRTWAAFTIDYNCYHQPTSQQVIRWRGGASRGGGDYYMTDLARYRARSGKEEHTLFADPQLNADHTLRAGSPAIDAGIDAGYPFSGTAPDIGAFEFRGNGHEPRAVKSP